MLVPHRRRTAQAARTSPPLPPQLAWQEDELTLFTHFGMNTFTSRSTGLGNEDPKTVTTRLPSTAINGRASRRNAGSRELFSPQNITDGFCLWPTATTEHSVKNSTWKDGKGDVVHELSDACKAGGIKLGNLLLALGTAT